jgi:hypothetical protein
VLAALDRSLDRPASPAGEITVGAGAALWW